jgi:cation diffusion facilitator CzcD-associated flavoprotein CzcO
MGSDTSVDYDVVTVGAGFAGMYLIHRLRAAGMRHLVFEAADGVGGTWYWNRYPGARCDVESLDYSYSFSPELEQEWEWSERFATQPEILRYANHVADRFDLRRDIRFRTRVTAAHWDAEGRRWTITTDTGDTVTARYYVMASGCLSTTKLPEIPGIEHFAGATFHTGHWPHEGVDFTGMRVGVIGTGSSGIQSIPVMAREAAQLTVFQRTPNFSIPARNRPLDPAAVADRKADYRAYREAAKRSAGGVPRVVAEVSALEVDPDERTAAFEEGWDDGGFVGILGRYPDMMTDEAANDTAAEFVRRKIRSIVHDPAVAEALCPTNHPLGTKRPCLDTDYYATFNLPHVRLVDLRRTPIVDVTASSIVTGDVDGAGATEVHEFDALVFATGFDAMTGTIVAVDITGTDGTTLKDAWAAGPRTYLGLCVAGFPNFFAVTGPGSPSVLSNMMVSIEQHVDWIADCLQALQENGTPVIEATREAQDQWVDHVNEVASMTLYPKANSWYMGANVPGKPRVFLPYVGGVGNYRLLCDEVAADGYRGFVRS